jgi:hypothetical protein
VALPLWQDLGLDQFWAARRPPSRKGTRGDRVLTGLPGCRLLAPGSAWRRHRAWFDRSARPDLLNADVSLADRHKLSAWHARLLPHKAARFQPRTARWRALFTASFAVLRSELPGTDIERAPPLPEEDKRTVGHSRDKRADGVPGVIALRGTPEGFPLA